MRAWINFACMTVVLGVLFMLFAPEANSAPYPGYGDWVIDDISNTYIGGSITVYGNVTIENGGRLELDGTTLIIDSNYDGEYGVYIKPGGELILTNGAMIVSSNPENRYNFVVEGQLTISYSEVKDMYGPESFTPGLGGLVAKENSNLMIDNSTIRDSAVGLNILSSANTNIHDCIFSNLSVGMYIADGALQVDYYNLIFDNCSTGIRTNENVSLYNCSFNNTVISIYVYGTTTVKGFEGSVEPNSIITESINAKYEQYWDVHLTVVHEETWLPIMGAEVILHDRYNYAYPPLYSDEFGMVNTTYLSYVKYLSNAPNYYSPYTITVKYNGTENYTITPLSGEHIATVALIQNTPPVPIIWQSHFVAYEDDIISFDASTSYDPDVGGYIVNYTWNFNDPYADETDPSLKYGESVSHVFKINGIYVVNLTIVDNHNAVSSIETQVNILNMVPYVTLSLPENAIEDQNVSFSCTGIDTVSNRNNLSISWQFVDPYCTPDNPEWINTTGEISNAFHTFTHSGTYTIYVTIKDWHGAKFTDSWTINITNLPPVANAGSDIVTLEDFIVTFNASQTYDTPTDMLTLTYTWDFGDPYCSPEDNIGYGIYPTHTYTFPGIYTVTLTVSDGDTFTIDTVLVQVDNLVPSIIFNIPSSANEDENVSFSCQGLDTSSDISTLNISWHFYDPYCTPNNPEWINTTGEFSSAFHTFTHSGNYLIEITVTDIHGAHTTVSYGITINNLAPIAYAGNDIWVTLGNTAYFSGSAFDTPSDIGSLTYHWDFGDFSYGSGQTTSHLYSAEGVYVVTLTVTDNNGAIGVDTLIVHVQYVAPPMKPSAHLQANKTMVYTFEPIQFDASSSYDADGIIVLYNISFGDGYYYEGVTPTTSHSYSDNGTYEVTLTIFDNDGMTDTYTIDIIVLNRKPTASISVSQNPANMDTMVTFQAIGATDSDGTVVMYEWNFNDPYATITNPNTMSGPFFSSAWHTYTFPGIYNVSLKVYDNDGDYCLIVMQMFINNVVPTANLPATYSANEDELITFSATVSDSASDISSLSCFWDFDAASGPLNCDAAGPTVKHSYPSAGTYTVAFVVFDRHNAVNIYYSTVTISNLPPTATISTPSQVVNMGTAVTFSAINVWDTPSDIPSLNYTWDFNTSDAKTADAYGQNVTWIFQDNTTYSISLTVKDNNGATGVYYMDIYSANVLPIAYAGLDVQVPMDTIVTLCGYASDTSFDLSTLNFTWDFADANATPDANIAYDINASHIYTWPGNYLVYFNVTDQHGGFASSHLWVNVTNVPPIADAGESIFAMSGVQFNVYGSGSTDTPSDIATLQYEWDFDGDTITDAYTCIASWTFHLAGTYIVSLKVTDQHGASSTDQLIVYVDDPSPLIANFTVSATEAFTGEVIHVDASSSIGSIISYDWDFGDSTTANGVTANHAYSSATSSNGGFYEIRLTVTDGSRYDYCSIWVRILNRAPVAYAGTDITTTMDTPVTFSDAYMSDPDTDYGLLSFEWDFGDPYDPTIETSNINPSHTYTVPGIYYATLRVTDNFGNTSTSTIKVTVNNYNPSGLTINVDANPVFEDMLVFLSATCTDTPSDTVVYFWDFDSSNGFSYDACGQYVATSYSTPGAKTITVWAFDKYGGSAQTIAVKFVVNRPPTIIEAISSVTDFSVYEDQAFILYAVAEDNVSDLPKLNYTWEISLSGSLVYTFYSAYVNLSIPNEGNYLAKITVKDDINNVDFRQFTITVQNAQPKLGVFANTTVYVDTPVSLLAKGNDNVSDLQTLVYLWDFGTDGSIDWNNPDAWGQTAVVTYYIPGNYTVSVKVTDDNGAFVIATIWVNVSNRPPFAVISQGGIVVEDDFAFFNAFGSFDSMYDTPQLTYSWDFDASDGISVDATGISVSHVYTNVGIYIVTLTVSDPYGATDTKTTWINVINGIPVAKAGPNQVTSMDSVVFFNGSASSDTISDIGTLNFTWDFGDTHCAPEDNIGYDAITSHIYTVPGTYTVTLTVRDIHDATNVSTLQVIVNNVQPIANAGLGQHVLMDDEVTFNGSLSWDTTTDFPLLNYTWDFGDPYSTPENNVGYGIFPTHIYTQPGNYTATLVVKDPHNAIHSATVWINVSNVQPVANAGLGQFAFMDFSVTFNASLSWDTDSDILLLNYTWNFGDPNATLEKNVGYGLEVSHIYTHPGNYTVTLIVTDPHGAFHTSTVWVNISNIVPVASPSEGVYSHEFDNVTFSVISFFDTASDISTLQFHWQFNDPYANTTNPNTMSGLSVWHVFTVAGNYTVTLTVVDRHGDYHISYTFANVSNLPPSCYAGEDIVVNEEESVTFTGLGFDTPYDLPLLNYTWDFGDSYIGYGISVVHYYRDAGNYTVTLTVRDSGGLIATDTLKVTVLNVAPIANAGPALQTYNGVPVIVTGSAIDTPNDLTNITYLWDMNALDGLGVDATGPSVTWTYNISAVYTVTLIVIDHHGLMNISTTTVTVLNLAPVAHAGNPQVVYEDEIVFFDASLTIDTPSDMPYLQYYWDFNASDGITIQATGITTTWVFTDIGTYLVTLTVRDISNATSQSTVTITVLNRAPVANAGTDISVNEDAVAYFSGVLSHDTNSDNLTLNYTWNFGDGSPLEYGIVASHIYRDVGVFTVTLMVRDIHGTTSLDTLLVTVTNVLPTCNAGSSMYGNEDQLLTFNGSATDSESDINSLTYTWSFGDGATATGRNVTHAYSQNGTYIATLTVTDIHGATASATIQVFISNLAPTAYAGLDISVEVGTSFTLTATATDTPSDIPTLTYSWDFDASNGIGIDANGPSVVHAYTHAGTYIVTLTVTDNNGATATDTVTITVYLTPPTCNAGDDITVEAGVTVHFLGSANDTPAHIPSLNYSWDFDASNGISSDAYGVSVEYTYLQVGTYIVTLTVTDIDGASATDTLTVTVQNTPPTCNAGNDITVPQYTTVHFVGSATDTPIDLPTLTYTWDFDASDGIGIDAVGAAVEHNYTKPGNYIVTLTVRDAHGAVATDTLYVNVTPVYSIPIIDAGTDISIEQGAQVTFSAIIVKTEYELDSSWFKWMANGLVIGTGKEITTNIFVDVGTFTVTLVVTLPDTNTITDTLQITVSNRLPTSTFECPAYLQKGQSTGELVAIVSDIDADILTLSYSWNFGDGTANVTTKSASHTYTTSGTYTITLVVTDRFGGVSQCVRTIVVNNTAPYVEKISFVKESRLGEKASFTLEGLYDSDGEIRRISWDFGDGSEKVSGGIELTNISHTYKEPGEYVVTVVIEDDEGKITTISDRITVKTDTTLPWILFVALIGLVFVLGFIASRRKPKHEEAEQSSDKEETVAHTTLETTPVRPTEQTQAQVSEEVKQMQKREDILNVLTQPAPQPQPQTPSTTMEKQENVPSPPSPSQTLPQTPQSESQVPLLSEQAEKQLDETTDEDSEGSMLSALLPPGASMPTEDKTEDKKE